MKVSKLTQSAVAAVISAILVFVLSVILEYISAPVSMVIWSVPFVLVVIVAAAFVGHSNNDEDSSNRVEIARSTVVSAFIMSLVSLIAVGGWAALVTFSFKSSSDNVRVWGSFGIGMAMWLVGAIIFLTVVYKNSSIHGFLIGK
jgi:hypothetical protein